MSLYSRLPEGPKPYLRAAKLAWLRRRAESRARRGSDGRQVPSLTTCFIVGCGRSGTTILGSLFERHPQAHYLREPYHLWACVEPRTDVNALYYKVADARFFLDEVDASPEAVQRFRRLFLESTAGGRSMVEKTPHNVARIGFIEALAPGSRWVHIVRDGVDVARSIDRLATGNFYRIAGRPDINQWWGSDGAKWKALAREGAARGYCADDVTALETHLQRGAYEWVVSLEEAARWRQRIGERFLEIRYVDFANATTESLQRLCEHFGIDAPAGWLAWAQQQVSPPRHNKGSTLKLPPCVAERFNRLQAEHDLLGRAESVSPASPRKSAS